MTLRSCRSFDSSADSKDIPFSHDLYLGHCSRENASGDEMGKRLRCSAVLIRTIYSNEVLWPSTSFSSDDFRAKSGRPFSGKGLRCFRGSDGRCLLRLRKWVTSAAIGTRRWNLRSNSAYCIYTHISVKSRYPLCISRRSILWISLIISGPL